jgi:hypothetical protein
MNDMAASKPLPAPDNPRLIPVQELEQAIRTVIAQMPPAQRQNAYSAYKDALLKARQGSSRKYPWDSPEAVTVLSTEECKPCILAVIESVPDPAPVRAHFAKSLAAMEKRLAQHPHAPEPQTGKWGKARCANVECGREFVLKSSVQVTCSPRCRRRKSLLRQRAMKAHALEPQP